MYFFIFFCLFWWYYLPEVEKMRDSATNACVSFSGKIYPKSSFCQEYIYCCTYALFIGKIWGKFCPVLHLICEFSITLPAFWQLSWQFACFACFWRSAIRISQEIGWSPICGIFCVTISFVAPWTSECNFLRNIMENIVFVVHIKHCWVM